MRSYKYLIVLLFIPFGLFGQQADKIIKKPLLRYEKSFGVNFNSDGWGVGYRVGKALSYKNKKTWDFNFSFIGDSKQERQLWISAQSSAKSFFYGKLMHFYGLQIMRGRQKIIAEKPYWGGVEVRWFYYGGLNLGIGKPIYLYVFDQTINNTITLERYDPAKHMIEVCGKNNTKLFYAEDWLNAPALKRVHALIEEGGIGDVLYVKAKEVHNGTHSPFAKKKETCGGGAFIHLGAHPVTWLLYLLGKEKVNQKLKNHSLIGAIYLLNKFKDDPFYAAILYYIIINHHSSLSNILDTGLFNANIEMDSFINRQLDDIHNNKDLINKEIDGLNIERFLTFPQDKVQKNIRKTIKKIIIKSPSVQHYFTINYLFSLLIEADKLDASGTSLYERKNLPENAVEKFIGKADSKKLPPLEKIDGYEQNTIRIGFVPPFWKTSKTKTY